VTVDPAAPCVMRLVVSSDHQSDVDLHYTVIAQAGPIGSAGRNDAIAVFSRAHPPRVNKRLEDLNAEELIHKNHPAVSSSLNNANTAGRLIL